MRIVIVMEKCLVQGVFADAPGCRYAAIDLDTEDVDRGRLCISPQGRECTIEIGEAERDPCCIDRVFRCRETDGVPPELVVDMAAALAEIIASHDNWRDCSDTREALNVWSETADKARRVLARVSGTQSREAGGRRLGVRRADAQASARTPKQ